MNKFSISIFALLLALVQARPQIENSTAVTTSTTSTISSSTSTGYNASSSTTTMAPTPKENSTVVPITPTTISVPQVLSPTAQVSETLEVKERTLESRAISEASTPINTNNGNKSQEAQFDGPIRRCSHTGSNADVNKCLRQILEDLKPRLGAGIPEINLPPMDPLYLDTVSFHHGSGPIKILATFSDVNASGLSTFDRSDFTFDIKKRTLDFDLTIPYMRIVGNYELSGNLFFFPIGGNGGFWLNMGGIRAKGQGKLGVSAKNNLKSIHIKKIDIDLDIETIKVHLTNLFHGDQLLGTVINNFLNENAKEIFEEVRPQIGLQVGEMVQLLTNRALASLADDHFADINVEPDV